MIFWSHYAVSLFHRCKAWSASVEKCTEAESAEECRREVGLEASCCNLVGKTLASWTDGWSTVES